MTKRKVLRKGDRAVYTRDDENIIIIIEGKHHTGQGQTHYYGHTEDGVLRTVLWSWYLRKCPKKVK